MEASKRYDYDTIKALRRDGMGYGAIAKKIGEQKAVIANICRHLGLGGTVGTKNKLTLLEVKEKIEKRYPGIEYVGGYTSSKKPVRIRYRECGHEREAVYGNFMCSNPLYDISKCSVCFNIQRKEEQKTKEHDARTKAEQHRQEKKQKKQAAEAELISRQLEARLAIHVCKNCGMSYCIETTGYNSTQYCSEKCGKRWNMRVKNDRRVRKMMQREHDTDITLEKLYAKESGRCYLCGGQCDWNDVDESGNAGEMYPSIDHVIPLSKGGKHKWDNIRLAHRGCNTKKRDSISPYGQKSP